MCVWLAKQSLVPQIELYVRKSFRHTYGHRHTKAYTMTQAYSHTYTSTHIYKHTHIQTHTYMHTPTQLQPCSDIISTIPLLLYMVKVINYSTPSCVHNVMRYIIKRSHTNKHTNINVLNNQLSKYHKLRTKM